MFEKLPALAPDPILGLAEVVKADPRPDKIDLTAGVYRDDRGVTPVFEAVRQAQLAHLEAETSKDYLPIAGSAEFGARVGELVLGSTGRSSRTIQTPGGTGALSIAAGVVAALSEHPTVWMPSPTWPNHPSIFKLRDVEVKQYRYTPVGAGRLDADALVADLAAVAPGDAVLVHGCCHNPTGVDPDAATWALIAEAIASRGAVAIVDLAYLGLGEGLDEDRHGLETVLAAGVDTLVCSSFSKNMGEYRERVGALSILAGDPDATVLAFDQAKAVIRATYSNPPSFGGSVVARVLGDPALRDLWTAELDRLRGRINALRSALAAEARRVGTPLLRDSDAEHGMFCMTGLDREAAIRLRDRHGIYVLESGRANVAALSESTIPRVVAAIAEVA